MVAPLELKPDPSQPTTPTNAFENTGYIECIVCTKLGRVLDCCRATHGPCSLCVEFFRLLNREVSEQVAYEVLHQNEQNDEAWRARCDDLEARLEASQETPEKRAQEKSDFILSRRLPPRSLRRAI